MILHSQCSDRSWRNQTSHVVDQVCIFSVYESIRPSLYTKILLASQTWNQIQIIGQCCTRCQWQWQKFSYTWQFCGRMSLYVNQCTVCQMSIMFVWSLSSHAWILWQTYITCIMSMCKCRHHENLIIRARFSSCLQYGSIIESRSLTCPFCACFFAEVEDWIIVECRLQVGCMETEMREGLGLPCWPYNMHPNNNHTVNILVRRWDRIIFC